MDEITIKSFTFYREYADLISLLSEAEQASLYLKIINYIFYDKEINDLTSNQTKVWINLKRPIDKSISQSKNVSKRYSNSTNEDTKEDTKETTNLDTNSSTNEDTKEDTQSKMYMSNVNVNSNMSNNLEKIGSREEKPLEKSKKLDAEYEEEFEKLWESYPNKKGKEQAKKKYINARHQGTTYEEVSKGLKAYINYCQHEIVEKKYIKHGSTWFNQQCWKDDYEISESKQVSRKAYKTKAEREEEAVKEFLKEHGVKEDE